MVELLRVVVTRGEEGLKKEKKRKKKKKEEEGKEEKKDKDRARFERVDTNSTHDRMMTSAVCSIHSESDCQSTMDCIVNMSIGHFVHVICH